VYTSIGPLEKTATAGLLVRSSSSTHFGHPMGSSSPRESTRTVDMPFVFIAIVVVIVVAWTIFLMAE
jgi:hypothetical protein